MTTVPAGETLVIENVAVFDGESADLLQGPVTVGGGEILAIGEPAPSSAQRVDGDGGTVVPGLIDAHFHAYGVDLDLFALETSPTSFVAIAATQRLGAALHRGFTTVRDVAGGDPGLARAIDMGLVPSPRYLYTGRALSQTGGHGDARPVEVAHCAMPGHMVEVVDGVEDLRVAVRDRLRQGAHAIKVMASGGVVSPSDPLKLPQYSPAELEVVVQESVRRESYVVAHSYTSDSIQTCVHSGVRSIEHGNLLDDETAALMAEHDVFLVPTLVAYDALDRRGAELGLSPFAQQKNREVLASGGAAAQRALAHGVRVGFGTDLMGRLEDEQLQGLRLQTSALGVLETLRSATSTNADLIGRPDLGRLQVGARADLLLLSRSPFDDPTVLWDEQSPRTVVQGGLVVSAAG